MNIALTFLAVLAFAVNCVAVRTFQLKCAATKSHTDLFQAAFCLVGALAYAIGGGFKFDLNAAQLASAALFGIFFAGAILFSAACYLCGPMSVTSVIGNSSVILPVLFSAVMWHEPVLRQIPGIVLLLATFVLSASGSGEKDKKRVNIKWLVFVLIYFVSNGVTAIIQKLYKISAPDSDGNGFMAVAYATAAIVTLVAFAVKYRAEAKAIPGKKPEKIKLLPLALVMTVIAGLGSFAGNGVLMSLSTKIPAAVLYPILNGGLCVTVSLTSILVFREKLTLKKALTIAVGLAAVVALNL